MVELPVEFVLFDDGAGAGAEIGAPVGGDVLLLGPLGGPAGEGGPAGLGGGLVPLMPDGGPEGGPGGAGAGAVPFTPLPLVELPRLLRVAPAASIWGVKEEQPSTTPVSRLMVVSSPDEHAE
jgi:hypothetical protein